MVNEEILSGLKSAVERGQSLKQAMISFYNAGYTKADIEEAAKALKEQKEVPAPVPVTQPAQTLPEKVKEKSEKKPKEKPKAPQRVSKYVERSGRPKSATLIVLIALLALLIGVLVLIFVFRNALIGVLNKLF